MPATQHTPATATAPRSRFAATRAWAGQGMAEFALVVAVVAVVAIPSMMYLQQMQRSFYEAHQASMTQSVDEAAFFVRTPTTDDNCKKNGWAELTDEDGTRFKNQGDCQSWVATNGSNEADGD